MRAAALVRTGLPRFFREAILVGGAYMAYEVVRGMASGRAVEALGNSFHVVRAEQTLGIFAELNIQVAVLGYDLLTDMLSIWYFWGHFPLILAFAIWAMYRHPDHYRWARNAVFISGAIALVVYVTFPVAPPRLVPGAGFADTLRGVFALQYDDSGIVNQYAAVPSMHQGFALIVGAALYRIHGGGHGLLWLLALPAVMFVTIVATGNHWILDAILGLGVALVGMWAATTLETRGHRITTPLRRWWADRRGIAPAH